MEQKDTNKLQTVLSLIAIAALVIFVIVMAIKGLSKDKDDDDIYTNLRQPITITPTIEPTPVHEHSNNITDITELLNKLSNDIVNYLQCTNPNIVTFNTPGVTLEKLGSMRTALGQSTVETWSYWKADSDLSTAALKGNYVINFNLNTDKGSKKLYVYVWTDSMDGLYVSMLTYEIGDF